MPLKDRDEIFGIKKEGKKYYIGKTHVTIKDNDINLVDQGTTLKGTPGIWELIMKKKTN